MGGGLSLFGRVSMRVANMPGGGAFASWAPNRLLKGTALSGAILAAVVAARR
jgi:hypothetical protein